MPSLPSIDWVVSWPVRSQEHARRNAQHAALACARQRRERETVDRFLSELDAPPPTRPPGLPAGLPPQRRAPSTR